jgi:hypothetical protein
LGDGLRDATGDALKLPRKPYCVVVYVNLFNNSNAVC